MIGKSIKPELEALIEARDFSTIREVLDDLFIPDIAEILSDIEPSDTAVVFRLLPKSVAAETFEYLDLEAQKDLLQELAHEQVWKSYPGRSPGI
jgi:magnesium transporter